MSPDPEERLKAQAECSVRQELYRSKTGKPRQDVGACLFLLDPLLNFSTSKRGEYLCRLWITRHNAFCFFCRWLKLNILISTGNRMFPNIKQELQVESRTLGTTGVIPNAEYEKTSTGCRGFSFLVILF